MISGDEPRPEVWPEDGQEIDIWDAMLVINDDSLNILIDFDKSPFSDFKVYSSDRKWLLSGSDS